MPEPFEFMGIMVTDLAVTDVKIENLPGQDVITTHVGMRLFPESIPVYLTFHVLDEEVT